MTFFGKIQHGVVKIGDMVAIGYDGGKIEIGEVLRFTEEFDTWLGLPFYNRLNIDSIEGQFCIEVLGIDTSSIPKSGLLKDSAKTQPWASPAPGRRAP